MDPERASGCDMDCAETVDAGGPCQGAKRQGAGSPLLLRDRGGHCQRRRLMQSTFRMAWAVLLLACLPGFAGAAEGAGLFSTDDGAAVPLRQAPGRLLREDAFPEGGLNGGTPGEPAPSSELRSRIAAIDLGRLEAAHSATSGGGGVASLSLNLFSDAQFKAAFDRSVPTASGYTLTGRLEGDPLSTVALAVNGEWVAGQVWGPEGRYVIRPLSGGVAEVRQVDPSSQGRCGVGAGLAEGPMDASPANSGRRDARHPSGAASAGPASGPDAFPEDDGSVIDLLVVYPSFARRSEGGHQAMRSLIESDVALTNEMYRVGGAHQRLNLVAAVEARRTALETRNDGMFKALQHVDEPSSGYMDEVPGLRDSYAADLVLVHWGNLRSGGTSGLARVLDRLDREDKERNGFSVSNSFAFAHELGHNMGLNHSRRERGFKSNLPFPYSYGYVHPLFQTIMSVVHSPIARFSNPRQWYPDEESGAPMGVPGDEPTQSDDGPADAVRSLNGTRQVVANFRRSASRCAYSLSVLPSVLPASGGEFRIRVRADSGCAWSAWSNEDFVSVPEGAGGIGSGELVFRVSANAGWERELAVFVAGEAYFAEQATAKERRETPACDRPTPIRDALEKAVGKPCGEIAAEDLAAIRTLNPRHFSLELEPDERRLAPGAFDGLTGLVSLDLSRMFLMGLAPGTFDGLIRLVSLDLRHNGFAELAAGTFDGLPNLVELKLRDNLRLKTLKPGAFRGLPSVYELHFNKTGLTALPAGAFEGLSSLRDLSFSWACSDPLPNEPYKCVAVHVPLATIEPGAFRGLSQLRSLGLVGHLFTTLEPGTFEGLPDLRILIVRGNAGLTALEPGLFKGLSKLDDLFLSGNSLAVLEPGLFDGLAELDGLELSGNQLKTLGPGAFRGLAALEQLILGENQLQALEPGVFDGLAKLDWVYLADNNLRTLDPGVFSGLTALRIVTLDGNELTTLDPALFRGTLDRYGYSQMFSLLLAGNRLATLDPGLFRGMIHLKRLDLSGNRFADLPPGLFEGLIGLNKLALLRNPGTPFSLVPELVRRPGTGSASGGPVEVVAEIAQGAPFGLRIPLSVSGGSLSAEEVLIAGGAVRGEPVSVVPQGSGPVTILAAAPVLPPAELCRPPGFWAQHSDPCLFGLITAASAPLVLHGLLDQTLAPDGSVRFDLPSAFPNFGASTSYAVESSNSAVVATTVREGLLIVSAARGGETILTVTATSPDGRRETRRFVVTALVQPPELAPLRSRWGGWRSILLKQPSSQDDDGS